jgi:sec-independent protein translocase protein TatA
MLNTSNPLALFGSLGTPEIVIIVLAILLLFGGKKLPELARGLGRSLRIFKEEVNGAKQEFQKSMDSESGEEKKPQEPTSTTTPQKPTQPDSAEKKQ